MLLRFVLLAGLLGAGAWAQAPALDSDADGYPDVAELRGDDRARFNDWFAAIAESQYYGMNADWRAADRDCAGLLRYAFVQALVKHDAAWRAKFKFLPPPTLPSVQNLKYPLPYLNHSVFRTVPGPYRVGDIDNGHMVGRTGAQYLANFSAQRVSRDIRDARRGDLLFFMRPRVGSYHSMVYLGGGMVVYHTGASPQEGGEVRLLSLATLMTNRDKAFHPVPNNPNFLGVYRWKILQ